jgi:hypothetical protein
MEGNAVTLWQKKGVTDISALPSPDGRHLAMLQATHGANIWLKENF